MGGTSNRPVTWQIHSSVTSTLGCPIVCAHMATDATLWLDMRDQFTDKHHAEWEGQKLLTRSLNNLEHNTEVVYRERLVKRENDKLAANSREAAAKELPPD